MKLCAFADEAAASMQGQIEAMRKNGITLLEIRHIDGVNIADISAREAREIRKMLDDAGVSVWSVGSPIGKYPLGEDFAPHLDSFCRTAELARILGASRMRIFSFFPEKGVDAKKTQTAVFERLAKLCEKAPAGLVLCHENEKEIYGESAAACLALHRELPRLRAVFDPANFVQCGEDTETAFDMLAPYIEYMHVKDADASGKVVLAGDGAGKIPLMIEKYRAIGGEVLTLEPHLREFIGFANLENGKSAQCSSIYKTGGEAFDAAATRLKTIISDIGVKLT
ncbi:MAG: sugar phosphate isomerase/epimerase [Clostridia bacterium]|nr:sugar phosphate isomerase/epimerase [Clostridia bacterium]